MDTKIEKEDIELLKPLGITCPFNENYQCGTFSTWAEYDAYDGEKWCMEHCIGKTGKPGHNKTADIVNRGLAHKRAFSGSPAYKLALENSINDGLLPKKRLTDYIGHIDRKRASGRRKLWELGRY